MPRAPFTKWNLTLLSLGLTMAFAGGCVGAGSPGTTPLREPGFRGSTVRRPAVLLRVSVPEDLSPRERTRIPEDYQAALVDGFDRLGVPVVDLSVAPAGRGRLLEGLDRAPALARARDAGAEHLVIVDARLASGDLVHCRQAGRAVAGPTVYWDAGLEIDRVSDGKPLLVEPPSESLRVVNVELDCKAGRVVKRKTIDEMIPASVDLVLAPFGSR